MFKLNKIVFNEKEIQEMEMIPLTFVLHQSKHTDRMKQSKYITGTTETIKYFMT